MDNPHPENEPAPLPSPRYHRERRRSIVGPLLLIVLGVLFLGQNMGLIPPGVWYSLWQFWPLLLVLLGIEMIFGRSSIGAAIGTIILVLVVLAVVGFLAFFPAFRTSTGGNGYSFGPAPTVTEKVVEDLRGATRATVDLRHGAGQLRVEALPAGSTQLVDADLSHTENATVSHDIGRQGDAATVQLRSQSQGNTVFAPGGTREDWTVRLAPQIPIELTVQSGASDMSLDLGGLNVKRLDVQAGASSLRVTLPQHAGRTQAHIGTGAASVDVTVPQGVAARIRTQGGLSGTNVDESRFPKAGNYYQSPNYDSAENRVDLEVDSGVSGVNIR